MNKHEIGINYEKLTLTGLNSIIRVFYFPCIIRLPPKSTENRGLLYLKKTFFILNLKTLKTAFFILKNKKRIQSMYKYSRIICHLRLKINYLTDLILVGGYKIYCGDFRRKSHIYNRSINNLITLNAKSPYFYNQPINVTGQIQSG